MGCDKFENKKLAEYKCNKYKQNFRYLSEI